MRNGESKLSGSRVKANGIEQLEAVVKGSERLRTVSNSCVWTVVSGRATRSEPKGMERTNKVSIDKNTSCVFNFKI